MQISVPVPCETIVEPAMVPQLLWAIPGLSDSDLSA